MTKYFDNFQKRRLRSSYASVVISIVLVLFMIGFLGIVLLKSEKVANHFKEEIIISLFLKDNITKQKLENFKKFLTSKEYTKKITYVSKEEAAKSYKKDLGEDFLKFLGENPLKNGFDLYLKAKFITPKKMKEISDELIKNNLISDISYDNLLVEQLTKNIKRITYWLFILSGFFSLVSVILINSSIRLSIYANRFNIKTMQMVGATKRFIRRPFIIESVKLGFIGAVISQVGLFFIVYYLNKHIPSLMLFDDYLPLCYLSIGILCISFIITWISTFFATQRFLNLHTNDLYY